MIKFDVKVADELFTVICAQPHTRDVFEDFLTDEQGGTVLCVTGKWREHIRSLVMQNESLRGVSLPPFRVEYLAIHEMMARALIERGVLLVHGAAVVANGSAVMFVAPSGTGKSTHTRLWTELPGKNAFIINDDKQFIRLNGQGATVYATPWGMISPMPAVRSAPLKAIVLLRRGENRIAPAEEAALFPEMLKASLRGNTPREAIQLLELHKRLLAVTEHYQMDCQPDLSAAEMAYNAVFGGGESIDTD